MSPGIVCAACSSPTTPRKPICDECRGLTGVPDLAPQPHCTLCEGGFARDKFGQHTTQTGGYVGKCSAVQPRD